MPTALIADDEPFMRIALREILQDVWPELEIVSEAEDGPQALAQIESFRPDVAFLDIRMPGLTGLEVAHAAPSSTRVVFVTAYDSHALEAFEANAVDYVLKPVERPRLARVVSKLRQGLKAPSETEVQQLRGLLSRLGVTAAPQAPAPSAIPTPTPAAAPAPIGAVPAAGAGAREWLQVSTGRKIRMAQYPDVIYFKSDEKYTLVVTTDWEGHIRMSLKDILDSAPPDLFLQVHRGTAVNRRFIAGVQMTDDRMEIELKGNATRLLVSQSNHGLFKAM